MKRTLPFILFVLMLALPALACGGGDEAAPPESEAADADAPAEGDAPAAEGDTAPAGPAAATTLEEVQNAVIQIEFLGAYRDPAVGAVSGSGYGSGFIIDPSGIAVTNNHVVAGAASLKVHIGGDTTETYNAKVLGVSECSDLAVIDIDGEGFPYLEWYQGDISVGTEAYAAGFPLGEPEYTLTSGIVSKASAPGETSWASVDAVIGHDATINPGNSGGPLVTGDGQVIGVNYSSRANVDQYFAISAEKAIPLTEQLRAGEDADSIGVNGQAVVSDDGSLSGVWVSSVVSGSPADLAGLEGGDVIVTMEGVQIATDGTMSDYCDILRSHAATDTLAIEVLRFDTQEGLEGQLNGEPLALAFSFAAAAETATEGRTGTGSLVRFNDALAGGGPDGADEFSFIGVTGGEVLAYVAPAADLDVGIAILDSNQNMVASVNDAGAGGAERLPYTVTGNADVYKIVVLGETGGDYEGVFIGSEQVYFELESQYLIAGSPPPGKSVGYALAGHSGETLKILVTSDSKAPIDAGIRIVSFSDLNTVLAEANNSGSGGVEALSFPVPQDGVYIVLVGDASGGGGSFLMATTVE
ncbi:MAG: S1C family serine protease [Anaerolineales bacterium]